MCFFLLPAFASLFVPFSCYCLLSLHASSFPLSFEILPPTCAAKRNNSRTTSCLAFHFVCQSSSNNVCCCLILHHKRGPIIVPNGKLQKFEKKCLPNLSQKTNQIQGIQVKVQVFPRPLSLVRGRWNVRLIGVHRQTVRSKESHHHKPPSQGSTCAQCLLTDRFAPARHGMIRRTWNDRQDD